MIDGSGSPAGMCCIGCSEPIEADDLFCATCGAAQILICPQCDAEYPLGDKFCMNDGTILVSKSRSFSRTPSATSDWADGFAKHASNARQALGPFWQRHKALLVISVIFLAGALAATEATGGLAPAAIAVALLMGWTVALSRSEKSLAFVDRVDGWTDNVEYYASHGGKVRRFIVFPIAWLTNMLALQTNRIPDVWSAAAVRLIAYLLATALVLFLVFWITMIIITLFIIGIALWILGAVMGDVGGGPTIPKVVKKKAIDHAAKRMRGKTIRAPGGALFRGAELASIDDDGTIRAPGGALFKGHEIGRIDEDGTIRGPDGSLFRGPELGHIDADGELRGPDGSIFRGAHAGRIDNDGKIRSRDGVIFKGPEVGEIDDD